MENNSKKDKAIEKYEFKTIKKLIINILKKNISIQIKTMSDNITIMEIFPIRCDRNYLVNIKLIIKEYR